MIGIIVQNLSMILFHFELFLFHIQIRSKSDIFDVRCLCTHLLAKVILLFSITFKLASFDLELLKFLFMLLLNHILPVLEFKLKILIKLWKLNCLIFYMNSWAIWISLILHQLMLTTVDSIEPFKVLISFIFARRCTRSYSVRRVQSSRCTAFVNHCRVI